VNLVDCMMCDVVLCVVCNGDVFVIHFICYVVYNTVVCV